MKTQLNLVRAVNKKSEPTRERRRVGKASAGKKAEKVENATRREPQLYDRPTLLVDGYNAIFGTERLNAEAKRGGLDGAREALIKGCEVLASARNWDVVVRVGKGCERLTFLSRGSCDLRVSSSQLRVSTHIFWDGEIISRLEFSRREWTLSL